MESLWVPRKRRSTVESTGVQKQGISFWFPMELGYLKEHYLNVMLFFWLNSNAGTSSTCDPRYNQTYLQRLVAPPLSGNAPDQKGMKGDGGKNGLCARPANSRKRVRKAPDAETACRGSSSSATNGLNGELEMRQGPHEDHCYSLQPPDSQTNIEECPQAKRKAPDCDEHAAERAELHGTLWAQKWQRWADRGRFRVRIHKSISRSWPIWDISVSQIWLLTSRRSLQ